MILFFNWLVFLKCIDEYSFIVKIDRITQQLKKIRIKEFVYPIRSSKILKKKKGKKKGSYSILYTSKSCFRNYTLVTRKKIL